jgi:uncharacterized protein YdeI (YjbR/CyaY-like superfamily)
MNPKVDFYFAKSKKWKEEIATLRAIILDCGLNEELKWGVPCYTYPVNTTSKKASSRNIVLIHEFKDYCAVLFFKGSLLKDSSKILIQQTENVQAARQIRFTGKQQIVKLARTIKSYIYEAIEIERVGLKVKLKKPSEFKMADEFKVKLDKSSELRTAFKALTPGRQRAYLLYFSAAKQSSTRESRVEKSINAILKGKGLND